MHLKSVHDTLDDKRLERRIMELENYVHSLGRQKNKLNGENIKNCEQNWVY